MATAERQQLPICWAGYGRSQPPRGSRFRSAPWTCRAVACSWAEVGEKSRGMLGCRGSTPRQRGHRLEWANVRPPRLSRSVMRNRMPSCDSI